MKSRATEQMKKKKGRQIPTSGSGRAEASNQDAVFEIIRRVREGGGIFLA